MTKDDLVSKDTALKMAYDWVNEYAPPEVVQAYKEALEQEERTQRTMHCGTADAFIAMDDDHKRRWFVQSLRESKRRKELEDILEQPAQPIELKPANIAKERDEIYYAWRKYWAWGIPSKDGEAVFNANGDGFLAGWLACEEWINKDKNI